MGEELQAGVCNSTWWNLPKSPFGYWPSGGDFVEEMNNHKATRSSDDSGGSVSDHQPDSGGGGGGGGGGVWMDSSTFQMMGINGISSPSSSTSTDWNQTLFGRRESNFNSSMIQEDMNSRLNFPPQIQKEWSTSTTTTTTTNGFNQTNQGFSLDQANSQDYPSIFLQTLFDSTDPQPQQPLFDNQSMTYSNEFSPSSFAKLSPLLSPSLPKQQPINPPLNLTQTAPFWNASSAPLSDIRASFFPLTTFEKKPNCPNLISKSNDEAVQDSCSAVGKKSSGEPVFKRPRIETPSPLPTFKVRKEKLGDRITALQQLVSPFGKTDTASVLQEAIEYIKFLHDQVNVLSTPYVKNGAPIRHQQNCDQLKNNSERPKPDLRSRGLCLVPITSTFPVANETSVDFWTPTFGSTSI